MEATSNSKTLLFAAQQFELLYNTQTVGDLDSLTATNVRLHKDAIFTHNDILGQKNLKQYFQVRWQSSIPAGMPTQLALVSGLATTCCW